MRAASLMALYITYSHYESMYLIVHVRLSQKILRARRLRISHQRRRLFHAHNEGWALQK